MSPPDDRDARTRRQVSRRGFLRGLSVSAGLAALQTPQPALAQAEVEPQTVPLDSGPPPPQAQVALTTRINGRDIERTVGAEESALQLLRDQLDMTGSKLGCGHGACGACTILLDGEPACACLLPATALEGRSVETVEGFRVISEGARRPEDGAALIPLTPLHPVQKAFLAEDGLQCGYCTPGFVTSGVAFYRRWRAQHPPDEAGVAPAPSRDQVAAGLAGNLCRCAAYDGIYRAVTRACAGEFEQGIPEYQRLDGPEKVSGEARYTVDVKRPGMLHGRFLRSPHAHAKLTTLDTAAAAALPGVHAIEVYTEAGGTVRFAGQEIAAVAAETEAQAEAAVRAIHTTWQVLPAALTLDAARQPDAPTVYADRPRRPHNASEGPAFAAGWDNNVRGPLGLLTINGGAARRAVSADENTRVHDTWRAHIQAHTALEPHATVAEWREDGGLDVWMSTQAIWYVTADIAAHYGLKRQQVHLRADYVGGGFGAKCGFKMEARAACDLARSSGRPVRVALDRAEELTVGGLRPETEIELALAADPEGALAGLESTSWHNGGAAIGGNSSVFLRIMYQRPPADPASTDEVPAFGGRTAKAMQDYDVCTHGAPGTPFRGPGAPAAYFALEAAVDEIARARNEDPLALRMRWDANPSRRAMYRWLGEQELWRNRRQGPDSGRFQRGVGVASGAWFYLHMPSTQVQLDAGPDGLVARSATQDMGNGTRSIIADAIGGILGIASRRIRVEVGSSQLVRGPMSAGSRTTASITPAAEHAAEQLREALLERAADELGLMAPRWEDGGVRHSGGHTPLDELLQGMDDVSFIGRRRRDQGGVFLGPVAGVNVGRGIAGALIVAEVEVDSWTGKVRVERVQAGFGVGRVRNQRLAHSQAAGGIIQGVSYALYEDWRLDPTTGRLLTAGLEDYRIAGIGDVPEMDIRFFREGFDHVQGGGVGIGELCTVPVAGAVANAVGHATGWYPRRLPLRPDAVLHQLGGRA